MICGTDSAQLTQALVYFYNVSSKFIVFIDLKRFDEERWCANLNWHHKRFGIIIAVNEISWCSTIDLLSSSLWYIVKPIYFSCSIGWFAPKQMPHQMPFAFHLKCLLFNMHAVSWVCNCNELGAKTEVQPIYVCIVCVSSFYAVLAVWINCILLQWCDKLGDVLVVNVLLGLTNKLTGFYEAKNITTWVLEAIVMGVLHLTYLY